MSDGYEQAFGRVVCASCGKPVWWGMPRPEDDCPDCGQPIGTGKQRPAARGSESREAELGYEKWLESLKDHGP